MSDVQDFKSATTPKETDEDAGQEGCVEDEYQTVKLCTSGIME